jgi:antitoxin CptB
LYNIEKIKWKCRRGTKELDLLLGKFFDQFFMDSDNKKKEAFVRLIDMQDPEIYDLLIGKKKAQNSDIESVIKLIRDI